MTVSRHRQVGADPIAVPQEQEQDSPEEAAQRLDPQLNVRRQGQRVHGPVHPVTLKQDNNFTGS